VLSSLCGFFSSRSRRHTRCYRDWSSDVCSSDLTRTMEIFCHGTSLPLENNSFSLDSELKDAWGLPALRLTYKDHPDDLKLVNWRSEERRIGKEWRSRVVRVLYKKEIGTITYEEC